MEKYNLSYALLCMQSALLGEVTPSLRAVLVDLIEKDKLLKFCFIYDGEINEELYETASCVMTEASSHFPIEYDVEESIVQLDYPQKLPSAGSFAYKRKEP